MLISPANIVIPVEASSTRPVSPRPQRRPPPSGHSLSTEPSPTHSRHSARGQNPVPVQYPQTAAKAPSIRHQPSPGTGTPAPPHSSSAHTCHSERSEESHRSAPNSSSHRLAPSVQEAGIQSLEVLNDLHKRNQRNPKITRITVQTTPHTTSPPRRSGWESKH